MFYLYKISNILNNKVYIGQSNKEKERWRQHKYYARQVNPIQYIHRAMAKYGIENFIYEVIAMCQEAKYTNEIETLLIQQYNSCNKKFGYNIAPGGNVAWNRGLPKEQQPMFGKKQSDFHSKRMTEVHKGKIVIFTEQTKQKISDSNKGSKRSEDTKRKMSEARIGFKHTIDSKNKMSKSHTGKIISEEQKRKMSDAHMKISIIQKLEIINLKKLGLTVKELSEKFQCSKQTIYNILKKN